MDTSSMHYGNVLSTFKIEWKAYEAIMSEDDPKVPKTVDRDGEGVLSVGNQSFWTI